MACTDEKRSLRVDIVKSIGLGLRGMEELRTVDAAVVASGGRRPVG